MWCSDPFLSVLKQYGYNVVRLPRTGIKPLQILMRAGSDLDRLGDLTTIMLPGPAIAGGHPGRDGQHLRAIDADRQHRGERGDPPLEQCRGRHGRIANGPGRQV